MLVILMIQWFIFLKFFILRHSIKLISLPRLTQNSVSDLNGPKFYTWLEFSRVIVDIGMAENLVFSSNVKFIVVHWVGRKNTTPFAPIKAHSVHVMIEGPFLRYTHDIKKNDLLIISKLSNILREFYLWPIQFKKKVLLHFLVQGFREKIQGLDSSIVIFI